MSMVQKTTVSSMAPRLWVMLAVNTFSTFSSKWRFGSWRGGGEEERGRGIMEWECGGGGEEERGRGNYGVGVWKSVKVYASIAKSCWVEFRNVLYTLYWTSKVGGYYSNVVCRKRFSTNEGSRLIAKKVCKCRNYCMYTIHLLVCQCSWELSSH